jgi:hypothetical protein
MNMMTNPQGKATIMLCRISLWEVDGSFAFVTVAFGDLEYIFLQLLE